MWTAMCNIPQKISAEASLLEEGSIPWALLVQLESIWRMYTMCGPVHSIELRSWTLKEVELSCVGQATFTFSVLKTLQKTGIHINLAKECDGFGPLIAILKKWVHSARPVLLHRKNSHPGRHVSVADREIAQSSFFLMRSGCCFQEASWSGMIHNSSMKYAGCAATIFQLRHAYATVVASRNPSDEQLASVAQAMVTSLPALRRCYVHQCHCEKSSAGMEMGITIFNAAINGNLSK
jgi:hypothetical protein